MKIDKPKGPTGKERMRRVQSMHNRPLVVEHDVKKAYTPEQLAEVGAISLIWNQIEITIDWLIFIALDLPLPLWMDVAKRIFGMDAKIDILQKQAEVSDVLNDEARKCIKTTLDAVLEYKKYRDAIIHSLIFDARAGIAQYIASKAKAYQIMMTMDALNGFYERLSILKTELREVDLLLRISRDDGRIQVQNDETGQLEPDQPKALREQAVPAQTERVLPFQKKRLTLPPLPEFPDADLILQAMAETETPPRSGGMVRG